MAASGEWIIMGDSDDSYDFSNLEQKDFLPIDIVDLMLRIFDKVFFGRWIFSLFGMVERSFHIMPINRNKAGA
jgi:hypothetical protein